MCFDQDVPIDNCTHVPGPVSQYSAESEYNAACTTGIDLAHFKMINNELMNKDPDVVTDKAPLIILDRKSAMCMDRNGKDDKHIRQNPRRINLVKNGKE